MTRGRVVLKYLKNRSARRVTYKKRMSGVLKKASELKTLCDIDIGGVIMSEFDATPIVWPSPSDFQHVVTRFNNLPEYEKTKHQSTLEDFNRKRLHKLQKKLHKLSCDNKYREASIKINKCLKGESSLEDYPQDLDAIELVIGRKLKEIDMKIKSLKTENPEMTRTDDMQVGESTNNNLGFALETQQPFSGWNDNPLSLFTYDVFQSLPPNVGDNHGA